MALKPYDIKNSGYMVHGNMNREGTTLAPHAHRPGGSVPGSAGEIAKILLPLRRKKRSSCP
jgi:hypothetical protein